MLPDMREPPSVTGLAPPELSPPIVRPARVALLSSWSLPLAIAVRTAVGAASSRPAGRMARRHRERTCPRWKPGGQRPTRAGRDLRAAVRESSCGILIKLTVGPLPR